MRTNFPEEISNFTSGISGSYGSSSWITDETTGDQNNICSAQLLTDAGLIEQALNTVCKSENAIIRDQAVKLLFLFRDLFKSFQAASVDTSRLPPLQAAIVEDGSILIEWIFPDFRMGFNIEQDTKNNSWFLVSSKKLDEFSSSGYLSTRNLRSTILNLLKFAINNS